MRATGSVAKLIVKGVNIKIDPETRNAFLIDVIILAMVSLPIETPSYY